MYLCHKHLIIRDALVSDAALLCRWWNDGAVMEHAGFPQGIHTTIEQVTAQILLETGPKYRLIIESHQTPIGEMCYQDMGNHTAQIGIKICELSFQNHGLGSEILSLFCKSLFEDYGFTKIILDTMLENKRAQHVYEKLGFVQTAINRDCWQDQTGKMRTSIDYTLLPSNFSPVIHLS